MDNIAQTLSDWFKYPLTGQVTTLLVVVVVVQSIVRLARRSVGHAVTHPELRYRVQKSISLSGYALFVVAAAVIFRDRLGDLPVALGVVGAGIAFALQEVVVSAAGWLAISLGSIFRPGDRVQLAGIKGDVIDVGILRTTLMELGEWVQGDQYSGRIVRIANSYVFKEPVFNYSGDFAFLWDEIRLPIKYGSDAERARSLIQEAATAVLGDYAAQAETAWKQLVKRYMLQDEETVSPTVMLTLTDNWMEFTLRYVVDYRSRRTIKDRLFTVMLHAIEGSGGQVALASATYHLVEAPVLNVRLQSDAPGPGRRDVNMLGLDRGAVPE